MLKKLVQHEHIYYEVMLCRAHI